MENFSWILLTSFIALGSCAQKSARCDMRPNTVGSYYDQVTGTIEFEQDSASSAVRVTIRMSGFNTSDAHSMHGIHVHTEALSTDGGNDCYSSGGHYNPDDHPHGGPDDLKPLRHAGDMGNVVERPDGTAELIIADSYISLQGEYNVIGRTFDVHQMRDTLDDSIDSSGGSGERLACCTIYEYAEPYTGNSVATITYSIMALSIAFVGVLLL